MPSSSIVDGVFAIHKPLSLSSAQVVRDAQTAFQDSTTFQPWFQREKERLDDFSPNQKKKRRSWKSKQQMQVKMGHGGTLDPMATGVLILGVGSGTKALSSFLDCTKSYECVVLFGAATDSYDAVGKIVARKDHSHITKQLVEKALGNFRGKIMQKPSIFSALKVNGKKMYEYAREGKELPIEIEARPVEVKGLEMVEWMDGGSHDFHWPTEEAPKQEKEVVEKVLKLDDDGAGAKRKRENDEVPGEPVEAEGISSSPKRLKGSPEPVMAGALPEETANPESPKKGVSPPPADSSKTARCLAPACRLRMTVTSGFYVRSLAHDLGEAVDSFGLMSSLVRSRQGDFALGQNVLDYDDLGKGEEVWGPKIQAMLKDWQSKEGSRAGAAKPVPRGSNKDASAEKKGRNNPSVTSGARSPRKRRRNSSSPESGGDGAVNNAMVMGMQDGGHDDGGYDDDDF